MVPVETQVLPVDGSCPSCKKSTQWIDIVKPLTYRLRVKVPEKKTKAAKKVTNCPKTTRGRKKKAVVVDYQMGYEESDEEGVVEEDWDEQEVSEADDGNSMGTASNSDTSDIDDLLWRDPVAGYDVQGTFSDMDTDEGVME